MTVNYPGPYELRYRIQVENLVHEHRLSLDLLSEPDVGDTFATINAASHDGTTNPLLTTLCDAYAELWADVYITSASTLLSCELWKYPASSFDATWKSVYTINRDGDVVGTVPLASQVILVFRTTEGGIAKAVYMESGTSPGVTVYPPYIASWAALNTHLKADTSPYLGRDTSRFAASVAMFPGQNEATFKARYR
jgi:hypothetical protein